MKNYGFKASEIDGTEHVLNLPSSLDLPLEYTYEDILPDVINQGEDPICVRCSISSYLNWRENLIYGEPVDNKIDLFDIYNSKTTDGDGMTFKEAFYHIRHEGVPSKKGNLKIGEYVMLRNDPELKYSILANGPCFGALPVYNASNEFWKRQGRQNLLGYHAIAIVGYTENGLIIRNSWGRSFGENGYTLLRGEDFGKLGEAWSIVG